MKRRCGGLSIGSMVLSALAAGVVAASAVLIDSRPAGFDGFVHAVRVGALGDGAFLLLIGLACGLGAASAVSSVRLARGRIGALAAAVCAASALAARLAWLSP